MNSSEDTYQPSAELARYHLRNAVMFFLQHPPLQGKAALDRLSDEIRSSYFPNSMQEAVSYFSSVPLNHPRDVLVRNFVIRITKELLLTDLDVNTENRHIAALCAVGQMFHSITATALHEKLNDIIRGVSDDQLVRVMRFLKNVDDCWQYLKDDMRNKLYHFVEKVQSPIVIRNVDLIKPNSSAYVGGAT